LGGAIGGRPGGGAGIANRPSQLPAERPGRFPGAGDGSIADNRPGQGDRPERPDRGDRWENIQNENGGRWDQWKQDNSDRINNIEINQSNNWSNINNRDFDWDQDFDGAEWNEWREDVWDYRSDRCEQIWDCREDFWDDCFDDHWWGSCWWRPAGAVAAGAAVGATVGAVLSPWWWWQPYSYPTASSFYAPTYATYVQQPATYDPGTTVVYEGDTYYVNGEASGPATEARQEVIALANPPVEEIPIPEPAPEGQPQQWLPMGVWALTQQEKGDATMFIQLNTDKEGLVSGAYKNILTGDEQPVIGKVDFENQRVAWHVGEANQTVYETGLANFEYDVTSVFIHFGEESTQTWLMVRLQSPEIPPGPVKLPDYASQ
jgi:hypothetical protein